MSATLEGAITTEKLGTDLSATTGATGSGARISLAEACSRSRDWTEVIVRGLESAKSIEYDSVAVGSGCSRWVLRGSRSRAQLAVDELILVRHALSGEPSPCQFSPPCSHTPPDLGIERLPDCRGKRAGIVWGHQHTRDAVDDSLRNASDIAGHDGNARMHGLEHDEWQRLEARGQNERIDRAQHGRRALRRTDQPNAVAQGESVAQEIAAEALGTLAGDARGDLGQFDQRVKENVESLLRREPANGADRRSFGRLVPANDRTVHDDAVLDHLDRTGSQSDQPLQLCCGAVPDRYVGVKVGGREAFEAALQRCRRRRRQVLHRDHLDPGRANRRRESVLT